MRISGDESMDVPEGWSIQENHLMREFSFEDFAQAKTFIDARALLPDSDPWVRGRLISSGKTSLEILDGDGVQRFIARDTIVQIVLIAHTRPAYIDDKELLAFEREDMKRRSTLHEKVEKETTGNDDAHLWG